MAVDGGGMWLERIILEIRTVATGGHCVVIRVSRGQKMHENEQRFHLEEKITLIHFHGFIMSFSMNIVLEFGSINKRFLRL